MVYVDSITDYTGFTKLRWKHWCHMVADTDEELHALAAKIGLKREWFQKKPGKRRGNHYDLIPTKRALAVRHGAKEISDRELSTFVVTGQLPA